MSNFVLKLAQVALYVSTVRVDLCVRSDGRRKVITDLFKKIIAIILNLLTFKIMNEDQKEQLERFLIKLLQGKKYVLLIHDEPISTVVTCIENANEARELIERTLTAKWVK